MREGAILSDQHGRQVSYMRLSVTDRCNLRCFYCWPKNSFRFMPHSDILRYEEFLRLIGVGRSLGIQKVRLTGGEPLVREGFLTFVERVFATYPGIDVRLTTNGTVLADKAGILKEMGLRTVNISMDTLQPEKFARITGQDLLGEVHRAVETCLHVGLKVKINAVALRGVNDDEVPDFVRLTEQWPVDIRFIEFMPVGGKTIWSREHFWPADEILATVRRVTDLESCSAEPGGGPATMYRPVGALGRIGVISGITGHFCHQCNRVRITAEGRMRTCLYSDREYRLRGLLRSAKIGDEALARVMRLANQNKPIGYMKLRERNQGVSVCDRTMTAIGG